MGAEAIQIRGPQREEKETVKGAGAEAIHIKCLQKGGGKKTIKGAGAEAAQAKGPQRIDNK